MAANPTHGILTDGQRLCLAVAESLGISPEDVALDSRFAELGVDSLQKVQLVLDLEDEFQIEIAEDDSQGIFTVRDLLRFL